MWSKHTAGLCPPPPPSLSRPPPLLSPPGAHSPSPSPVPASAPQPPQGPGQPCRPQGSHPMPGSIRSRDTSPQKGEGAAGGSALLCITNGAAALQWEAGTTLSCTVPPRCPFIPWSSRPARNASCVSCGPSQPVPRVRAGSAHPAPSAPCPRPCGGFLERDTAKCRETPERPVIAAIVCCSSGRCAGMSGVTETVCPWPCSSPLPQT